MRHGLTPWGPSEFGLGTPPSRPYPSTIQGKPPTQPTVLCAHQVQSCQCQASRSGLLLNPDSAPELFPIRSPSTTLHHSPNVDFFLIFAFAQHLKRSFVALFIPYDNFVLSLLPSPIFCVLCAFVSLPERSHHLTARYCIRSSCASVSGRSLF